MLALTISSYTRTGKETKDENQLTLSRLRLNRPLHARQAGLILRIARVDLQALLIGVVRADEVAQTVQSGSLAAPSLGPVRLDLRGLGGVLEGVLVVLLGGVGRRAVRVQDVVRGLELDGLGEVLTIRGGDMLEYTAKKK